MKLKQRLIVAFLLAGALIPLSAEALTRINSSGSKTLLYAAKSWAAAYQQTNPDVQVEVYGGESGSAIAALINGSIDIANTSREMREREIRLAQKRGRNPKKTLVGYDAVALFVHKDNPIESISIPELIELFGEDGKFSRWTQLGVEVPNCKGQKIVFVGRQVTSGTYAYFRKNVLGTTCYKWDMHVMFDSNEVVDLVGKNPCAIGYSGLIHATNAVKSVCVSENDTKDCVNPAIDTVSDGSYPITRPLFMYTITQPQGEIKAYLDWIVSDEGQCIIRREGYAPIRATACD